MRSPPSLRHWRIGGNPVPFGTGTWRRRLRPRDGAERERGDAMRCDVGGDGGGRREGGIKLSDSRLNNQRARPCTTTARSLVDPDTWRTRLAGLFVRLLMASSYQQPFPLFFFFFLLLLLLLLLTGKRPKHARASSAAAAAALKAISILPRRRRRIHFTPPLPSFAVAEQIAAAKQQRI